MQRSRTLSAIGLGRVYFAALMLGALSLGACRTSNVEVRTQTAPGVLFTGRHTFHILNTPSPRGGLALETNDPMLDNSLTNRALREDIRNALIAHGYTPARGDAADLDVAYYAAANRVLDINTFPYGYTWRGWPREYTNVTSFEQGTVVIDLIDPVSHELLWRGRGVAPVSTDPNKYVRELNTAVDAIAKKLP